MKQSRIISIIAGVSFCLSYLAFPAFAFGMLGYAIFEFYQEAK